MEYHACHTNHQSTFKFVEYHACHTNPHSSSWRTTPAIQVRGVRGAPRLPHQSTFKFVEYNACHTNPHSSSWSTTPAIPIDIQVQVRGDHTNRHFSSWSVRLLHQSKFQFVECGSTTPPAPIAIQVCGVPGPPHPSTLKFVDYHACRTNRHSSSWSNTPATPIDIQVRGVPCLPHQ